MLCGCGSHKNNSKTIKLLLWLLLLGDICSSSSFTSPLLIVSKMSPNESSPLINHEDANGGDKDIRSRIATMRQLMQEIHDSRVNFSYDWRKTQLTKLSAMVEENWDAILDALMKDLNKDATEASVIEMLPFRAEVSYLLANTRKLMQPEDRTSIGGVVPAFSKLTPQPRNGPAVLVIGPYNYPISIPLMAVAGSLAAGNPTVIKPSELCPATSTLLSNLVNQYFDPSVLQVVEGGIPETSALMEQEWGMIHFTGSERVGKVRTFMIAFARKKIKRWRCLMTPLVRSDYCWCWCQNIDSLCVGIGREMSLSCG